MFHRAIKKVMGLFQHKEEGVKSSNSFFDQVTYNRDKMQLDGAVNKFNSFTIPFLQDIAYLTSVDDFDKIRYTLSLDREECYKILKDDYLNRNGRGPQTLQKFYDFIKAHHLGTQSDNSKNDRTKVIFQEQLDPVPSCKNADVCRFVVDEETENFKLVYDEAEFRDRYVFKLDGKAAEGYKRLLNLCQALNDVSTHYFVLSTYVFLDEATGEWQIRKDIPFGRIINVGR